jgi:type I restriction enzyme, R subunit
VLLADDELREEFYGRLSEFGKTLGIALSSEKFLTETDEKTLSRYKADLRKFQSLKASVKHRYAESIDYRDYEPKIKKLLDTHIQASEVVQLNKPVNIFDDEAFKAVKEEQAIYGSAQKTTASKADTIAHATKKVITEKMDEDPAFYEKFSKLIQQAIEAFRAKRISDLDYLNKVVDIRNKVVGKVHDDIPDKLSGNEDAMAYFGVLKPFLTTKDTKNTKDLEPRNSRIHTEDGHNSSLSTQHSAFAEEAAADAAIAIHGILEKHRKVHFWDDEDAQKQAVNEIDDYLYDELKRERGIELSLDQMDVIIEKVLQVGKFRMMSAK